MDVLQFSNSFLDIAMKITAIIVIIGARMPDNMPTNDAIKKMLAINPRIAPIRTNVQYLLIIAKTPSRIEIWKKNYGQPTVESEEW